MTLVIRITLSLFAIITLVTISADADAQIFRRMRDNIRMSYPPQGQVAPQPQRPVQVAPQPRGQVGPALTPYSRLTPEQRNATTAAQPAPKMIPANPNVKSDQVNVRVVTYFDPRTGRTFQRRFIVPANGDAANQPDRQKIAGGSAPAPGPAAPQKRVYDKIPRPAVVTPPQQLSPRPNVSVVQQSQQPKFNIPPIRVEQTPTPIQQTPVTNQQLPMPILAGPTSVVANPTMTSPAPMTSPGLVTPSVQPPALQVSPTPSVAIVNTPIDAGRQIVIDTAVAPATATTTEDTNIGSAASVDGAQTAFSVLESSDDEAASVVESSDFDIEINSADEVEAFFGE